jgi:response regulator of citrate/malate metabolism
MNDYITKPINAKQLSEVLDSWVNLQVGLKVKKQVEIKQPEGIFDLQRFNEMSLGDVDFQRELLMIILKI